MATLPYRPYNPYSRNAGAAPGSAPSVSYGTPQPKQPYYPPQAPASPEAPPAPPSSQSSQAAAGSYMPGEGIYAQDSAAAYDAYNAAIAASEKDSQSARAQFGFNANGSNLDPSNSTGLFQRLMRSQAQTGDADHEEALSRGLGGSGLGAQIGEQHNFQNQGDLADLTNNYQGLLAAAMARKGDAGTSLTNALLAARQHQLAFDLQNQLFGGAGGSGGSGGGSGDGSGGGDQTVQDTYWNPKTKQTIAYRPANRTAGMYAT